MTKTYALPSQVQPLDAFIRGDFSDAEIKNEPMFFGATLLHAYDKGGPITHAFIEALGEAGWSEDNEPHDAIFDSRAHMLMPGMWPCIPGWHHDDVFRPAPGAQPDYDWMLADPERNPQHILGLVNADVAPTEFLTYDGVRRFPKVEQGNVYKVWNDLIEGERRMQINATEVIQAEDRRLYQFDGTGLHRGVGAVKHGWRWFGRVSWQTTRKTKNEIRQQVQVYMEDPTIGW